MADPQAKTIKFRVPGVDSASAPAERGAAVTGSQPVVDAEGNLFKHAVTVATTRDGGLAPVEAVIGEDIVVLQIENGPELRLHPETAADLMRAQIPMSRSERGARAQADASDDVFVPIQLGWEGLEAGRPARGATRGLGGVILKAFKILTGIGKNKIADLAVDKLVEKMDGQVDEGVYRLEQSSLAPLKGSGRKLGADSMPLRADAKPTLVLIHGTFSSTDGTFSKLWSEQHSIVERLFKLYEGAVYALDHRTLAVSPITNALTLAKALPAGAKLHLLTHSRGGLVAEVFARICAAPGDVALFDGAGDFAGQLNELRELADVIAAKHITVERMVRVACPVRGTLLASKRLDAYLSVLKWALELAQLPVVPELVELLSAIAKERTDPAKLPGLQAQMPDSRMVQWLHAVGQPIAGDLRVIAGDMQGDSLKSWVKTLLADSFYWTDNDLVVQTRSMYGGAPRQNGAQFVFDQGGAVSHFNYFRNNRTAQAVFEGLTSVTPSGFNVIGPLSWAGQASEGLRGKFATSADDPSQRDKPLVFLMPGIVGSNLKVGDDRIWLGWHLINGFGRLAYSLDVADHVKPDGPIGLTYDKLSDFLAESHAVVEFAYDWRQPIEVEAARLAREVNDALRMRESNGLSVRIIAHSMGGLVARAMQIVDGDVWARMMARDGARVLMLGTPNGGSWAPMQVLSGDDTFGNVLGMAGAPFHGHQARQWMADFPGLIQLQADLVGDRKLDRAETWEKLAADDLKWVEEHSIWHRLPIQLDDSRWGVPNQTILDRAVAFRQKLDRQLENSSEDFRDNVVLVVGHADATPDGYEEAGPGGFAYLDLPDEGDGRVTHQRAMLPGVRTWSVDSDHGNLPRQREAFAGYLELLTQGETKLLSELSTTSREAKASAPRQRSRPSRDRQETRPPERPGDVLRAQSPVAETAAPLRGLALRVTVLNGDLSFISDPLMLGHYRSLRVTGTERVMDRLIGGTMQQSLTLGRYPIEPGTNQVFDNTRPHAFHEMPRPRAVIIVGLGDEGALRPQRLVDTIRDGTLAWAQRLAEERTPVPPVFELAATLIGSGGVGMSAGESAQCIVQGISEANELLARQEEDVVQPTGFSVGDRKLRKRWPRVGHLKLIELYLDRATEAWQAVRAQAIASPDRYTLDEVIGEGQGALRRPTESGYRGADYDFVSALTVGKDDDTRIAFSADSRRARTEVRDQSVQLKLVRRMVYAAANAGTRDSQLGRSLYRLLVPPTIAPMLGGSAAVVLELDSGTMGVPWELLDAPGSGPGSSPWAVRSKLLRKLRVPDAAQPNTDANADSSILVIGEPETDRALYPPLEGARREAVAVADLLSTQRLPDGGQVKPLIRPQDRKLPGHNADTIINALFERDWRILHITGHGEPPEWVSAKSGSAERAERRGEPKGVVLSDGIFLGPRELARMTAVPELVFLNCCHLAAVRSDEALELRRAEFAIGVPEELIRIGVRCVITAAWAVDDAAAEVFATTFYRSLLRGARFLDAVSDARAAAHAGGGNTWAAYQCYGDPDWTFAREVDDAQRPRAPLGNDMDVIASALALRIAIDAVRIGANNDGVDLARLAQKLDTLAARYGPRWGKRGEIAEAFGLAWNELGDRSKALQYLEVAVRAADGGAAIKAVEQLCNVRARLAWDDVRDAVDAGTPLKEPVEKGALAIEEALALLGQIATYQATMERESLRGSACKRLAMIHAANGDSQRENAALAEMTKHYSLSLDAGRTAGSADLHYPGLNLLAGSLVTAPGLRYVFDEARVAEITRALDARVRQDPDFWSVAGQLELRLYQAVGAGALAGVLDDIMAGYRDLRERVGAPRKWDSIYDTAYFVLGKYAGVSVSSVGERKAANDLLSLLRAFTSQ